MSVAAVNEAPKKKGLLAGAKSLLVLSLVIAAMAAFGALQIIGSAADQVPYYVLSSDVPARTQITPDLLVEVQTSQGGQPRTAYDLAWVQTNADDAFTRIPLQAGDTLTPSNTGPLRRITAGLPPNFVAASFKVDPADAVAGKVRRGDYIEIAATSDGASAAEGSLSKIVMHHVLVLDVTVDPTSIAEAANEGQEGQNIDPGPESAAVRDGIPQLYTVAVTPKDFTRLTLLKGAKLSVALSANEPGATSDASTSSTEVFNGDPVTDSGKGTEKVFDVADDPASK